MAKTLEPLKKAQTIAAKPWLTAADMRLLEAICETLIPVVDVEVALDPHGLFRRPASAMQVAQGMAETLADEDAETRAEFRQLLGILRGPTGGILLIGRPVGFMRMKPEVRERALRSMANSNVAKLRQGFQAMKRLAMFVFYAGPNPDGGDNPNWAAVGFVSPPAPPTVPKSIHPLNITGETTLDADVVVVGSGAGGGVIAAELSAAGKSVIVVEKGGYFNESDFTGHEAEMMPNLYLKRGLQSTKDLSMAILAGSCLGGGTVVNWSTSFRAPEMVLQEWERDYGLSGFTGSEFAAHYDAVSARIGVNLDDSAPNANNAIIERGCEKLSYHWAPIPRNANHCEQRCGACGYGCAYGRKQSTLLTYLQDAANKGARFVVDCTVERVTMDHGEATGVHAMALDRATGQRHRVTIRAKTVVLCAGALHTPAILLRSGVSNANLGRHLKLHPVVAVAGFYPEPIRTWEGSLQTRYSDQFAQGISHGFKIEVAPGHPGLLGLASPWESGRQHKEYMQRLSTVSAMIVLVRDKNSGRITLDKHGEPVVDYPLGDHERKQLATGLVEGTKIHLAAGATSVGTLHSRLTMFDVPADGNPSPDALNAYLREVEERSLEPNRTMLFSAHQMGSARMASDARRGVIGPDHAVFGTRGLYVADGSAFPSASGVNPMLTILALAHRAAQSIKTTR